jgi:hypothetical protein
VIRTANREGDLPADARYLDDPATTLFTHQLQESTHDLHRGKEQCRNLVLHLFSRHLLGRTDETVASIVDDDINPTVHHEILGNSALDVFLARNVEFLNLQMSSICVRQFPQRIRPTDNSNDLISFG